MLKDTRDSHTEQTRILLVDDDRQVLNVLVAALTDWDVVTTCALTATDAIADFEACTPHITLIDQMLPGARGTDLIARFAQGDPAPLQFLATGAADDQTLKLALASGAWSVLSKPYRLSDVFEIIELQRVLAAALPLDAALSDEHRHDNALTVAVSETQFPSSPEIARMLAFVGGFTEHRTEIRRVAEIVTELTCALRNLKLNHPDMASAIELHALPDAAGFRVTLRCDQARFDWRRELARARNDSQSSRIGGLYLASCLASSVDLDDDGALAFVCRAGANP
ncbi:response regulator [candidate division KSB1 bacterium]|nr:response regulator [candidate division KSB1 bacterium]